MSHGLSLRLLILNLIMIKISLQYSIEYFDCNDVTDLKTYKQERMCKLKPKTNSTTMKQFTILQKQDIQETTGFSCKITRSTIVEYCGAYSHNKLAKVPEIEVHEAVTVEKCHHLVNTQSFITKEGKASIKIAPKIWLPPMTSASSISMKIVLAAGDNLPDSGVTSLTTFCRSPNTRLWCRKRNSSLIIQKIKLKSQLTISCSHLMLKLEDVK